MNILQILFGNSGLITSIIALAALVVAALSFISNHDRQKKQSTIEYYNKISDEASGPLRVAISQALNETLINYSYRTISPSEELWSGNPELQKKCFKYCKFMERFAVGIKLRIYDYKTFYNIAGMSTAKLFLQIQHLIEKNKHTDYQSYIFCVEYKKLCGKLLKRMYSKNLNS